MLRGNGPSKRELYTDAVRLRNSAEVDRLIRVERCSVNLRLDSQTLDTGLHTAIKLRDVELVKVFLANGADLKVENKDKLTPIKLARQLNLNDILLAIAQNLPTNVAINPDDREILQSLGTVVTASSQASQYQPERQQPVRPASNTDIFLAIRNGNIEQVRQCLHDGVDLTQKDSQGNTPLYLASLIESFDIVTYIAQNLPPNLALNQADLALVNLFREEKYAPAPANAAARVPEPMQVSRPVTILSQPAQNQRPLNQPTPKELFIDALEHEDLEKISACLRNVTANVFLDLVSRDVGLHIAVKKNNVTMIKLLMANRARINIENAAGVNPLQLAVNTGKWDCVCAIIDTYNRELHGDCNDLISQLLVTIRSNQETHAASANKSGDVNDDVINAVLKNDYYKIASLLRNGRSPYYKIDNESNTLLHWAAGNGDCEILKLLLRNDVNLMLMNSQGITPIQLAHLNRQHDALKLFSDYVKSGQAKNNVSLVDAELLALASANQENVPMEISPAQPQKTPREIYFAAISAGDAAVIQASFAHVSPDISVDANLNTALHIAVRGNNTDLVKTLLQGKASLNVRNNDLYTPIQLAARNGNWEMIKTIALSMSRDNGNPDAVDSALIYIARDNLFINGSSPSLPELFVMAATKKYQRLVAFLYEAGMRTNIPVDKDLNTVLHIAALQNDVSAIHNVRLDVSNAGVVTNMSGLTPLKIAVRDNKWDVAKVLIEFCPDKSDLESAYIAAVLAKEVSVIRQMLQTKLAYLGSPNIRIDNKLNTALHYAVSQNHSAMMEVLLGHNAQITLKNKDGKSPLDLALENNAWDCIKTLVERSGTLKGDISQYKSTFVKAIAAERLDVADTFLNAGVDPDTAIDNDENTLLQLAMQKKDRSLVLKMLGFGALPFKKNKNGKSAFEMAVDANEWELAILCISGSSRDLRDPAQLKDAFGLAVQGKKHQIIDTLINAGVSPDTILDDKQNTAMHYAVLLSSADMVAVLLRRGASASPVNAMTHTPVKLCFHKKDWAVLKAIADHCPPAQRANCQFDGILLFAMRELQVELIESLLKAGANPNAIIDRNTDETYLHYAITKKNPALVGILVKHGSNLRFTNKETLNPVQLAIKEQEWDCLHAMIANAPDANIDRNVLDEALSEMLRTKQHAKALKLIVMGASTQCFVAPRGKELFQEVMKDKACHDLLVSLMFEKNSRVIRDLVAKCGTLNQEIADSEILFDPIMMEEITEGVLIERLDENGKPIPQRDYDKKYTLGPYVTPQGATFQKDVLAKSNYRCPITREQFNAEQLVKNENYYDLLLYYKLPHVDLIVPPPCLVDQQTKNMFVDPLLAADGKTYEKNYLLQYLARNQNKNPSGQYQNLRYTKNADDRNNPIHPPLERYKNRQAASLIEFISKKQLEAKAAAEKAEAQKNGVAAPANTGEKRSAPDVGTDASDDASKREKKSSDGIVSNQLRKK